VVWASGDQSIAQALSISLASIRAKAGSRRAGRPPYTVIVLLPSASLGLSALISSWANRKARIESGKEGMRGRIPGLASWDILGLGSLSLRFGSPESHSSEAISDEGKETELHAKQSPSEGHSSPDRPSTPGRTSGKRRRLSFGNWTATDVFGYGKDLLKGLQIGQTESSGIGAVIPVVADTSTSDGIHHAYSTIRAYCTSHDLLLRGLVVLPSIMNSPSSSASAVQTPVRQSSKESHRSSAGSRSREVTAALETEAQSQVKGLHTLSSTALDGTRAALLTDVGEAMNVVASLAPALKSDGGRVIALVPNAFRRLQIERARSEHDDNMEFNITRRAMLEMWSGLTQKLAQENIQVSQVHMSASSSSSAANKTLLTSTKSAKHSSRSSSYSSVRSRMRLMSRQALSQAHYVLYPIPYKRQSATASRGYSSEKEEVQDDTDSLCPPLLLEAIRSVLVRGWPRSHYYIGLGPHLENIWECVPGHNMLQTWIQSLL